MKLIRFRGNWYSLIFTDHAVERMRLREVEIKTVTEIIESGSIKAKNVDYKFWAYQHLENRSDNLISVAFSVEGENLVVITVLVNWKVTNEN